MKPGDKRLLNLRPAKKGEVRNPLGGASHNKALKGLRRFTNEYLKELIELAVMGNMQGLVNIIKDPDAPAIKVGIAKSLVQAITKGDWAVLERIVERIVGKVPVILEQHVNQTISQESPEQRQERIQSALLKLKELEEAK